MRTTGRDLRTGSGTIDADLVHATQSGNAEAPEQLFRRYAQTVSRLAFRLAGRFADTGPIVEETFKQALARMDELAFARAVRPWLVGFVVQVAHEAIRRRHLRARLRLGRPPGSEFEAYLGTLPEGTAATLRAFYDRVDRLPLIARTIFVLRYLERLKPTEIASALDMTVADVRRSLDKTERRLGVSVPGVAA